MGGALSTGRAVVIFPDLSRIFIFLIALLCLSTTQVSQDIYVNPHKFKPFMLGIPLDSWNKA